MRFGEKVCRLRTQNGLAQEQLADMLGVTKRTIIGYERDGRHKLHEQLFPEDSRLPVLVTFD